MRAAEDLKARGFAGVMLPVKMHDGHTYESADYDPLWEAVAGLRLPVSMHVACHRTPGDASQILGNRGARLSLPVNAADNHIRIALTDMVYAGVFERHPDLRVCSVEHEGSWVFHLLQRLDWTYRYDRRYYPAGPAVPRRLAAERLRAAQRGDLLHRGPVPRPEPARSRRRTISPGAATSRTPRARSRTPTTASRTSSTAYRTASG